MKRLVRRWRPRQDSNLRPAVKGTPRRPTNEVQRMNQERGRWLAFRGGAPLPHLAQQPEDATGCGEYDGRRPLDRERSGNAHGEAPESPRLWSNWPAGRRGRVRSAKESSPGVGAATDATATASAAVPAPPPEAPPVPQRRASSGAGTAFVLVAALKRHGPPPGARVDRPLAASRRRDLVSLPDPANADAEVGSARRDTTGPNAAEPRCEGRAVSIPHPVQESK